MNGADLLISTSEATAMCEGRFSAAARNSRAWALSASKGAQDPRGHVLCRPDVSDHLVCFSWWNVVCCLHMIIGNDEGSLCEASCNSLLKIHLSTEASQGLQES